jgi:hypothetical protein
MSVAPRAGIVDFGTFTPSTPLKDGIQGEVPQPLSTEVGYVLSTEGWVSAFAAPATDIAMQIQRARVFIQTQRIMAQQILKAGL